MTPLILSSILLAATPAPNPLTVYDDVVKLVESNYYDQTYGGLAFDKAADEQRRSLTPASDDATLHGAVNSLLGRMGRSHTKFLSTDDQEYWALKSIFSGDLDGAPVKHIGIWFERRGARWFARNVFPGGPAAVAGIVRGDEMLTVDGQPFSPVALAWPRG
jgi:carboxyl-terminal processing protease